ncbi:MAG: hypothetical protein CFE25_05780 [Chitinophagaceae bacterium BSSC1]|nr:MAG: hypothetical protein CFE25_05780 [Chitinophagaceae bacterium BSSC1]
MKQSTAISAFSKFYANVLKQLGIKKETAQETPEPNKEVELPKDEVSYLYGFKTIIKNDKVGKALVMSLPSRKSSSESKTKKDEPLGN